MDGYLAPSWRGVARGVRRDRRLLRSGFSDGAGVLSGRLEVNAIVADGKAGASANADDDKQCKMDGVWTLSAWCDGSV